jgi:hypothetical protein
MANFTRFKWIPMIVKAYNQAKQHTEVTHHAPELPTLSGSSISTSGNTKDGVTRNGGGGSDGIHTFQRTRQVSVPSRRTKAPRQRCSVVLKPTNIGTSHSDQQKPFSVQYQQMIRELRQTKVKLGQLESIHRRLTDSQVQIQSQLSQLSQLLTEMKQSERNDPTPITSGSEQTSMPNIP